MIDPREEIEGLVRTGDLKGLLRKAGELHGHFCPYLALGVRAGNTALKALGIEQNLGMEEVVAIVETNNCFSDGIQVVTGCTFANNALIYRDLGKTAVTVAKRDGSAVRVALKAEYADAFGSKYPEAHALFEKIVVNREEATQAEHEKLMRLWAESSFEQLELPEEEVFNVKHTKIKVPPFAPMFASVRCSVCGENIMETRARVRDGKPICLECAAAEHYVLDGAGISIQKGATS
ncbi:MAG: TraR/DksA C4-type zinc finger protein [Anaerolineae bacterium]|nr:TraR/DksA C4-type zinc finger protein [Anaerolineae bacterium]